MQFFVHENEAQKASASAAAKEGAKYVDTVISAVVAGEWVGMLCGLAGWWMERNI